MENSNKYMDALNVISFILGYLNYEENLTQSDKQEIMHAFDEQTIVILKEIHDHLERQDRLLSHISEILNEKNK